MELISKYRQIIHDRYHDLKRSDKKVSDFDNNDLWKIFEYFTCIKLTEEFKRQFYEYNDIDPNYKEENDLTRNDTGFDASDMIDSIVQCKLRKGSLTWTECGTFFGSRDVYDEKIDQVIVKWKNLIIARNAESTLSENLAHRSKMFIDKKYARDELISYCEEILKNKPKQIINKPEKIVLRDYQKECIELIQKKKNICVSLPTGCGKNVIIINSMKEGSRYLILVPRIILMEQFKQELIKHRPELQNTMSFIGDTHYKYEKHKNIIVCVFNSVKQVEKYWGDFDKVFVDEAHHIDKPMIYENDDDESDDSEDELSAHKYLSIIRTKKQFNNNVYLSATIDKIDNFEYYSKDIRWMIENNYLCDYVLTIPVFNDDPTNKNICEYVIKNYRNVIIYCQSQKEGREINKLMNSIQKNISEYIDCFTPLKDRNDTINRYKKGEVSFLVNVRILVEGFDAPITKGVFFLHLPSSKTSAIQIIGRALRKHPEKRFANIILPCSADDDEKSINNWNIRTRWFFISKAFIGK